MQNVGEFGTSVDIEALAQHSSSQVRTVLASSRDTPPEVLRILASDTNSSVKLAAALNPSCPLDILKSLSLDTDWSVRLGLANQLDVGEEILAALLTHRNPYLAAQSKHAIAAATFERKLKEENIVVVQGGQYRLGELLVGAKLLSPENLIKALKLGKEHNLRLGRVLLQTEIVRASALFEALRLQMLLRAKQIELGSVYEMIASAK
jgi:hypothetical protein